MSKREYHPYGEFIPQKPKLMIIGSFPIGKFSDPARRHEIKDHEFDFFFGGERNLLWKLVGDVYGVRFQNREVLIDFLEQEGIAIGDVIRSCVRKNGSASDSDLLEIEWNEALLEVIEKHQIKVLLFTSKKVQSWFRRLFPQCQLTEILLFSPSSQSVRSIVRRADYKLWKEKNPRLPAYKFILNGYKSAFKRVKKINLRDL